MKNSVAHFLTTPDRTGRWPPPQRGGYVIGMDKPFMILHEQTLDCDALVHRCIPFRTDHEGFHEYVSNTYSVDVSTGIARVSMERPCFVDGIMELDFHLVDGVKLICHCGYQIDKDAVDAVRYGDI